jgi:aminomethyltransferase
MKKTTLYNTHLKFNAKMGEFAGFSLPLKYISEIEEHNNVRKNVGLFDVSHMGEIEIKGPDAQQFCQFITTNDVTKLYDGRIQYAVMCTKEGTCVDDVTLYRFNKNHFMFCVNASNMEKDFSHLLNNKSSNWNLEISNKSLEYDQLALQGPNAEKTLQKIATTNLNEIKYYHFKVTKIENIECIISRTGYTGESGFEIYLNPKYTEKIWNLLIEKGKDFGITACGLIARDTLRLEAGFMLYGNDLDESITPIESGLSWVVKINKGEFLGKEILAKHLNGEITKKLIGFKMLDRGIPRGHNKIFYNNEPIGYVSSGGYSPTLKIGIGMGFVNPKLELDKHDIEIEIREEKKKATITKMPFYKKT